MSDNPLVAAPVIPPAPPGETLPPPTPEQQQTADELFARPQEHHAALDLLGMVAATQLLHDLATDNFRRCEHDEDEVDEKDKPRLPDGGEQ